MPYTGDIVGTPSDYVRFLIGDTNPTAPYTLSDTEVADLLTLNGNNPYRAAIAAGYAIIGRINGYFDQTVGGVSMSYSQIVKNFNDTIGRLQVQMAMAGGFAPYAGGTSNIDKWINTQNPDRPRRDFKRDRRTAAPYQWSWTQWQPWQGGFDETPW